MLKTKSIYSPIEKNDGKRVLVSRLHPRGVKKTKYDAWNMELSPSLELIREFKDDKITLKKFFSRYKKELENNPKSIKTLKAIRKDCKTRHITLLCFEPDGSPCHRHILKEIIKKQKLLKESFVPKFFDN